MGIILFWLILHPNPFYIPINTKIGRVFTPILAHCLSIHRRGMEKILKDLEINGLPKNHIDKYYHTILNYKYATYPAISYQTKPPALYLKGKTALYKKFGISLPSNFTKFNKFLNSVWIIIFILIIIIIVIVIIVYIFKRYKL